MNVIQLKKPPVDVAQNQNKASDIDFSKAKDLTRKAAAIAVLIGVGLLKGVRLAIFTILLWVKPFICGVANFLCVICFILGCVFYALPRFNEHYHVLFIASFICFLISFAYETIIFKLAGDDAVRLY